MKTLIFSLMMVSFLGSLVLAAKAGAPPAWWCFKGVDKNAQVVEACERKKSVCDYDIETQELDSTKVQCVGAVKAYTFVLRHKNDSSTETMALPELGACKFFEREMVNEDIEIVSGCQLTP